MVIVLEAILGMSPEIINYKPLVFENSYRYFRFFYLTATFFPLLILVLPVASFFSYRNLNKIIGMSFLIGSFLFFINAVFFYSNSIFKIFFVILCFAILHTSMFMLLYKLILRLKNKIFVVGLFCGFLPLRNLAMLVTSSLFVHDPVLRSRIVVYGMSAIFMVFFILYSFITKNEPVEKQISYKNFSIRFFVYLINILKQYSVLSLIFYLFMCGAIFGLIQQYMLHYVVFSNTYAVFSDNITFSTFLLLQKLIYLILFLLIILISVFVSKRRFNTIFFFSSLLLALNIIFILIFGGDKYLLNRFLLVNFIWYCTFVFFVILVKYIDKRNINKFNIVLSLGFVSYLFGFINSDWINILFVSKYMQLLMALFIIIFIYLKIRDR
ncbi:hypothetical protein F7310_09980 [Francisella uliginis]|uniref:Uncharacterized protein n=2 Tax=Francisella uliginis TaxID=573570 RepID=A0A1L4BUZ6_9GAMM|nr:hypothetical protein F7310_09980 [Francisella uliginis]